MGEQVEIGLGFVLVLEGNALLNLSILGLHPSVVFIAIGVQLGQCTQTLLGATIVNEPTR